MNKETNLLDLCRSVWHLCIKGLLACWALVAGMLRLTFRYWFIVFPVWGIMTAYLYYRARPEHRKYEVNAIVLLNGPSVEHFKQTYEGIMSNNPYSDTQNLWTLLQIEPGEAGKLQKWECFDVIDMLKDGTPDYVDTHHSAARNDTLVWRMQDRAAIRFRLLYDINLLPKVEEALLRYFNSNPTMQREYELYMANMRRQAKFNHDQIEKLDSLTSAFYFQQSLTQKQVTVNDRNMILGDRRIRLFLDEINKHMNHTQIFDQRLTQATAPVVFEHHLNPGLSRYYHPYIMFVVNMLVGWLVGCLIGAIVFFRKEIIAFLRG